ncbi:phage portal protein [Sphingobacterium sp. ML3W]|uniref:phage portal protein n=1 Tax=Sphingobacterium sp. ML3W TaxID=1538644 RepID=UPI00249B65E4|nr:phage portal protein [Sphingobacterium sp. ML3W]WFA79647.1 phage portal protein [Sphingobacterium sp. ML3W]
MGLKQFAAKTLFGGYINQTVNQQVAESLSGLVNANLYHLIGKDQPILTHDNTDYVREGGLSVGAVYECVDLIMKKVVACPPVVYEVKDSTKLKMYDNMMKSNNIVDRAKSKSIKAEAIEEVHVPKISGLLSNPNDKQTWDEFVGLITLLYLYDGNALVYGNAGDKRSKKWSEIWALPFNSKQFGIRSGGIFDPIKSYYVQPNGGDILLDFPAAQIEHIKTINPTWDSSGSWIYGVSPLRAYLGNLLRAKLGDNAANKMLNNEGAFGVLSPKAKEDQFDAAQKKALHERLTDAQKSKDPMARIFPTSIPLEWLQIGLPATDLQLLDMLKLNREDFYRAYHVPLAFASTDANTYNNISSANKQFIYNGVAPITETISKALTKFICGPYKDTDNKTYIIRLDYMSLPELSEDLKEMVEALDKMDYITDNEKREVVGWGKQKDPAYDVAYKNKNKAPMSQIYEGATIQDRPTNNENKNG